MNRCFNWREDGIRFSKASILAKRVDHSFCRLSKHLSRSLVGLETVAELTEALTGAEEGRFFNGDTALMTETSCGSTSSVSLPASAFFSFLILYFGIESLSICSRVRTTQNLQGSSQRTQGSDPITLTLHLAHKSCGSKDAIA